MLKAHKVGLALGLFFGFLKLVWSLLVLLNLAQPLLDLCYAMHMIEGQALVMPFDLTSAITLIISSIILGYVLGWIFAKIYNWSYK